MYDTSIDCLYMYHTGKYVFYILCTCFVHALYRFCTCFVHALYRFCTCFVQVERFESRLASAPIVCMDGNIPVETLQYICDVCNRNNVPGSFPLSPLPLPLSPLPLSPLSLSLLFPSLSLSLSSCFLMHISGRLTTLTMAGVWNINVHFNLPQWIVHTYICTSSSLLRSFINPLSFSLPSCLPFPHSKHKVWFEPTGPDKASALLHGGVLDRVSYTSPNLAELRSIHCCLVDSLPPTKPHATGICTN